MILKLIYLTHRRVTVDQSVMAMKGYSTLPKSKELEPHHQMQFSVVPRTLLFFFFCGEEGYLSAVSKSACGLPLMDILALADQQKFTFISFVWTLGAV